MDDKEERDRLRYHDTMLFPEFDVEAEGWKCLFTLQENNTWVGKFEGVVLKPIGADPKSLKTSPLEGENKWIQFQVRNLTDKEVCFPTVLTESKLLFADGETKLLFPYAPPDKDFNGFAAHSHEGSIYRPESGSKIRLVWANVGGPVPEGGATELPSQTFDLPEFDPELDFWFCYFTLHPDGTWSAVFEGTKQK